MSRRGEGIYKKPRVSIGDKCLHLKSGAGSHDTSNTVYRAEITKRPGVIDSWHASEHFPAI